MDFVYIVIGIVAVALGGLVVWDLIRRYHARQEAEDAAAKKELARQRRLLAKDQRAKMNQVKDANKVMSNPATNEGMDNGHLYGGLNGQSRRDFTQE